MEQFPEPVPDEVAHLVAGLLKDQWDLVEDWAKTYLKTNPLEVRRLGSFLKDNKTDLQNTAARDEVLSKFLDTRVAEIRVAFATFIHGSKDVFVKRQRLEAGIAAVHDAVIQPSDAEFADKRFTWFNQGRVHALHPAITGFRAALDTLGKDVPLPDPATAYEINFVLAAHIELNPVGISSSRLDVNYDFPSAFKLQSAFKPLRNVIIRPHPRAVAFDLYHLRSNNAGLILDCYQLTLAHEHSDSWEKFLAASSAGRPSLLDQVLASVAPLGKLYAIHVIYVTPHDELTLVGKQKTTKITPTACDKNPTLPRFINDRKNVGLTRHLDPVGLNKVPVTEFLACVPERDMVGLKNMATSA